MNRGNELLRDPQGTDGQAAPHESSEEGELIRDEADADVEIRAVVIDPGHANRQKLQDEACQCGGQEQPQLLPAFLSDDIPKEKSRNYIA